MADDVLLTTDELAQVLGVRPPTIRRWSREKIIPEIRVNAKVRRFSYADVVQALRKQSAKLTEGEQ